jgi:protein-disulfide isomerase
LNSKIINIELQHFNDCPNAPGLIERVKAAIKDFDNINYKEVLVDSNEKAEEVKFRGSPTLLINGEDFENQPEPETPALACRYYINGLPATEEIKNKIIQAESLLK